MIRSLPEKDILAFYEKGDLPDILQWDIVSE